MPGPTCLGVEFGFPPPNAKAKGITMITIAYDLDDTATPPTFSSNLL